MWKATALLALLPFALTAQDDTGKLLQNAAALSSAGKYAQAEPLLTRATAEGALPIIAGYFEDKHLSHCCVVSPDVGRVKVNLFESMLAQMSGKPALLCTSSPICGKNVACAL